MRVVDRRSGKVELDGKDLIRLSQEKTKRIQKELGI